MKTKALFVAFFAGLLVGGTVSKDWLMSKAEAKPADVLGSPNIAVDTYRNTAGTFTLMSDGTIHVVSSANSAVLALAGKDLGAGYTQPSSSSGILSPSFTPGKPTGSPNVALKAVTRTDGTFILFADGNLKTPGNAFAAARSAAPGRAFTFSTPAFDPNHSMPAGWTGTTPDGTLTWNGSSFVMNLQEGLQGTTTALGQATLFNSEHGGLNESITLPGAVSPDGMTITFTFSVFGWNWDPSKTFMLYFSATVTGD